MNTDSKYMRGAMMLLALLMLGSMMGAVHDHDHGGAAHDCAVCVATVLFSVAVVAAALHLTTVQRPTFLPVASDAPAYSADASRVCGTRAPPRA